MATDWTQSREAGIQMGRIPGSCQSLGMDFRDLQGGRREGGTASSVLFLWESEAGSTADAVTHGGILPGIINLALLTAPWTGVVAFREGNLVSNPP